MQNKHLTKYKFYSWLKTLRKLGRAWNFLNLTKRHYRSPTVNVILNDERLKDFLL